MSLQAAYNLSISDLVHVLNEKLGLESSKFRGISLPPALSAGSLESEISSLEARARGALSLVLSLRNLSRPVNRLPPEILSYIARYLVKDRDWDAISIVPLTHVCRYWRESIISAPGNWTLISGKNEDMAAVCLQRAKAAPLNVTLWMPLGSPSSDIFAPHFKTTRTLTVHSISTIRELTSVFPNSPQSMPTLRSLELRGCLDSADWDWSIDPFESFIPALECLVLGDIPLYPSLVGLATLTELAIKNAHFDLPLDTLLDFLEGNPALERVTLEIFFPHHSLRTLQRKTVMKNQLRYLGIRADKTDARDLISNIPIRRGAGLDIILDDVDEDGTLDDFLPGISTAHLSNPPSPTFFKLEHGPYTKHIILDGPGGKLSFYGISLLEASFAGIAVLPLTNVRKVCLSYQKETMPTIPKPTAFDSTYFPALETLTINRNADVLGVLSVLLSNSPPSPSLKTIGFLDCDLSEEVMEELTKFASERQNIPTSTWLHRVQIVHSDGVFPSAASIRKLRKYVKVVETRIEDKFSTDLM